MGAFVAFFAFSGVAVAQTTSVAPDVSLQPWVVALLAGTVTPLLAGLVTKLSASSGVKAVAGILFTAAATAVNVIVTNNGNFNYRDVILLFFTTFVAHVSTYYGVWKPVGANNPAPTWGIGTPTYKGP